MRSTAELETDWIRDVLEEYQAALTRYAMRITGDLEKARDVVQDTFLKLCRQEPARIGRTSGPVALHGVPEPGAGCKKKGESHDGLTEGGRLHRC